MTGKREEEEEREKLGVNANPCSGNENIFAGQEAKYRC